MSQKLQWDASAKAWDHHFDWLVRSLGPFIEWCCEATALMPGTRALDVASGTGIPALAMAARVQPHGFVAAVDISAGMLALAERRASAMQLGRIEFNVMDAEKLAFADNSFDAATSLFGLMFCPDPAHAVAELRRVLVSGGRYAIVVWDEPGRNSFLSVFGRAAVKVLMLKRPPSDAPGPFRLAPTGALVSTLRAGGLSALTVESRSVPVVYESLDAYLETSRALAAGLKPKLDALSPADSAALDDFVREGAEPFRRGSSYHFTATALCATGRV